MATCLCTCAAHAYAHAYAHVHTYVYTHVYARLHPCPYTCPHTCFDSCEAELTELRARVNMTVAKKALDIGIVHARTHARSLARTHARTHPQVPDFEAPEWREALHECARYDHVDVAELLLKASRAMLD